MRPERLLLAGLLAATASIRAQDFHAAIEGQVRDQQQRAISAAAVTLKDTSTQQEWIATSTGQGAYFFPAVPPGTYQLAAAAAGFETVVHANVPVRINEMLRLDLILMPGAPGLPVALDHNTASLATAVSTDLRNNLPLKGRNTMFLHTVPPGAVNRQYREDARPYDFAQNAAFSLNGGPIGATDVVLDGVIATANLNQNFNALPLSPALDAVGELRVETGTLSAEFGRSAGSTINITTRSGTNQLHGSLYEFFRNSALDAKNYFATSLPRTTSNNFGASAGGPVSIPRYYDGKNTTFWFANYEGLRETSQFTFTSFGTPSDAMRQGDFREVRMAIYNPFACTISPGGTVTRSPFPGNQIPASLQDPAGKQIINSYPHMTSPGLFVFTGSTRRYYDMVAIKLDHRLNDRYTTFLRVNTGAGELSFPYSFEGPGTNRQLNRISQTGAAWGNTVTLSASRVLQARFGFTRGKNETRPWSDDVDRSGAPLMPTPAFPS